MIAEISTAFISGPCRIERAVMGKDLKSDHFKLLKDADQNVEDLVIEGLAYPDTKIRESGFTRDMFHGDSGIGAISPTSILVPKDFKEMTHVLMTVDMTKKVKEEQAWWIITRRSIGRITIGNKRSDKRKIDEGRDHFAVTPLDIAIFEDFNKTFFKSVG